MYKYINAKVNSRGGGGGGGGGAVRLIDGGDGGRLLRVNRHTRGRCCSQYGTVVVPHPCALSTYCINSLWRCGDW